MAGLYFSEEELKRLSWQCRRGIKEVEVLLVPFYEHFFLELAESDQRIFVAFLDEPDVEMFEWFTRRAVPENPDYKHIVDVILTRLASRPSA